MKKKKVFKKCYISAPAELNVQQLTELLTDKKIEVFDAFSVWSADITLPLVEDKIKLN